MLLSSDMHNARLLLLVLSTVFATACATESEGTTEQDVQNWTYCTPVGNASECFNPASNFPVAPYNSYDAHNVCVAICGTLSPTGVADTRQNATACSMYAPDGNHVYGRCTMPI